MKVKIFVAALAAALVMSVQGFANGFFSPCDARCVDPCAACDHRPIARSGDMFSGLKRLVSGVRANNCDPCEPVVACNPCDAVCGLPRVSLGNRLRSMFATRGCNDFDLCGPCDIVACDPCGIVDNGCFDDGCGPRFNRPFRNLFGGFRLNRSGCFVDCDPRGPCDIVACDPCDFVCNDFDRCGPRRFELPQFNFRGLFGGLRNNRCIDSHMCDPCEKVGPCCESRFFR